MVNIKLINPNVVDAMLVGCVYHQAIKFHIDVEGFWYPKLIKTNAPIADCARRCPIINKEDWYESGGFEKPHCYALINPE